MKLLCIFVAVVAAVVAQEYEIHPQIEIESYPLWYLREQQARTRRDVSTLDIDRRVGDGRLFGQLGNTADGGLYGKAGYARPIFNDHRGQLDGKVYGSRVLGPYGDSSHMGGALNWKNSNAAASLEASKQIHGPSSISAAAGGRWPLGKNGDIKAQGYYQQSSGMGRDYGAKASLNYNF